MVQWLAHWHTEVLDSVLGQGEIDMEYAISVVHPAHMGVMSRRGLYLVEGKAARSDWPSPS